MLTLETFSKAPEEFAPVAFWFLNHLLEREEAAWQIAQMKEKGVAGFFMHPREGLQTPYLSEEWFDFLRFLVEEAGRQGLKAWLYDEDPCPSGIAGGKVTLDHPEYRAWGLEWTEARVKGAGPVRLALPEGSLAGAFAISAQDGGMVDLTSQVGMMRDTWVCKYWHSKYYYPTRKIHWHWRSLTFFPRQELAWEAPEGEWLVMGFAAVPYADDGQHGTYTDLLKPEAVEYFLQVTYEGYRSHLGNHFGRTIPGIFTDEPKLVVPLPWTERLPEEFLRQRGYDLVRELPHLVKDLGPETGKVRRDYRETLLRMLRQNYFERIRRWCERNRLLFIGHVSPEEDPYYQALCLSDLAPHLESFHIPGTDIIIPAVGDHDHAVLNLGPKLVSSVACRQGKKRILCEAFACGEWDFTLAQMKHITDYLYVLGVNMLIPHAFSYSIDGYRKRDAAPSQFYQATYWPYYRVYSDYVRRLSYALSAGQQIVNLAVVWPMRRLWELLPSEEQQAREVRDGFVSLSNQLLNNQWDFHYVGEEALSKAKTEGGRLLVGKEAYSCLLLPPTALVDADATLVLEGFVREGGTVLDMRPEAPSGIKNWVKCPSGPGLVEILEARIPKMVRIANGDLIFFMHRREGQKELYFFVNLTTRRWQARVWVRSQGVGEIWDPATGETSALPSETEADGTTFTLTFAPAQSYLVVFSPPGRVRKESPHHVAGGRGVVMEFTGPWKATALQENWLVLKSWQMRLDGKGPWKACIPSPLQEHVKVPEGQLRPTIFGPVYAPRTKSGANSPIQVEYRASLLVRAKPGRARLVLEKSGVIGEFALYLNESRVGHFCRKRVYDVNNLVAEVGSHLKDGRNEIRLEVVADPSGGLLEPVRLMGKFGVALEEDGATITQMPASLTPGSWTEQGFPFYSGTICCETDFRLDERPAQALLSFPAVADMADVWVNGEHAGLLAWPPLEVAITSLLKAGLNRLRMDVTNSMTNLLDGKQKPSGLLKAPRLLLLPFRSS